MKKLIKIIIILFIAISPLVSFGQLEDPGDGSGGVDGAPGPVGGGAPIGSGLATLVIMGLAYSGVKKLSFNDEERK